jgi:DNA polymerase (family 10)
MTKRQIARVLQDIAFFFRLREDNPYKARAYAQAGEALLACPEDPQRLVESGNLIQVKGIGPATAAVITELVMTGASTLHRTVQGSYPASLVELGEVPRLTYKQIRKLYEDAGIGSIAELTAACRSNRLLSIRGIGPKGQAKLEMALGEYRRGQGYRLYADVLEEGSRLTGDLRGIPRVQRLSVAGALRRRMEVINEYRFVVSGANLSLARLMQGVTALPTISDCRTIDKGLVATSAAGMPMTITLVPSEDHDMDLLLATGSDEHLERLRQKGKAKGLGNWTAMRQRMKGLSEQAIYQALDLPFIPPELREGGHAFEGIEQNGWIPLVDSSDIQGCFHVHTDYSDGVDSLEAMVCAARNRGFRYVGISDHSQTAFYANGLKEPRIREQWHEIDSLQRRYRDIRIFKGIEADILPDGTMDYPDSLLAEFDFVIASVHSRFNLPEADQTRRICRALSHPHVTMLGHPTGRLLLSRPPYRINVAQMVDAARRYGKLLEINGSRHRLDLDWRVVQYAKSQGVRFCINPDAHAVDEMDNVFWGVNVARKGALSSGDVANTKSVVEMKRFLKDMRSQPSQEDSAS